MRVLDNTNMVPVLVLLIVIGAFALIAIVAYVIHRILHPKLKNEVEKPTDDQAVKENLDRLLEPVEDEETASKIAEYKDEDE